MSVELRRGVPRLFARTGGVMLELRRDHFSGRDRWFCIAHFGLNVFLDRGQPRVHRLPVRLPDPLIAPDQRRQADGFRRAEARIPSGAMPLCRDLFALSIRISVRLYIPDELLAGVWVLPVDEALVLFLADFAGQPHFRREP